MAIEQHQLLIYWSFYHKRFIKPKFDVMESRDQFFIPTNGAAVGVQKIKTSQLEYVSVFVGLQFDFSWTANNF